MSSKKLKPRSSDFLDHFPPIILPGPKSGSGQEGFAAEAPVGLTYVADQDKSFEQMNSRW